MSLSFYKSNSDIDERYSLISERILQITDENVVSSNLQDYFNHVVSFVVSVFPVIEKKNDNFLYQLSLEELRTLSANIFNVFDEKTYSSSYLCPEYAVEQLGQTLGGALSSVFYQMTSIVQYAYAGRLDIVTIYLELFVEIYGLCQMEEDERELKNSILQSIYYFKHDYCNIFNSERIISQINPEYDFYLNILMNFDLSKDDYMYQTGLYVSDNETAIAAHLRSLDHESVVAMARTFVDGYIKGFEVTGKDISIKENVGLNVPLGFEIMTREAVKLFNEAGLSCTLRFGGDTMRDWYSTCANKQCHYDHKDDDAFVLDKGLVDRRLEVIKNTFEKNADIAAVYGGPAVIETFGEKSFEPKPNKANAAFSSKQDELNVYYMSTNGQLTNKYIKGEERSFTIIAYPIPEIGPAFKEIFDETVAVNTMDYAQYQKIQAAIISVLDKGEKVHITGKGDNRTDIIVRLHHLQDSSKQTNFENCVADVNIPVGEVFTSPVLEGTDGILHVTHADINGIAYRNLQMTFKDGMVTDYCCTNSSDDAANQKLIFDNILFKHKTLPMGEFAIGTNTKAFMMGQKFDIADKLPILIAEKTGPHFAVGDTCYSHCEDIPMYNPDKKECIARDNSCSIKRKTDFAEAYFNCHTDITIPYDELAGIYAVHDDGSETAIIEDGKFVLEGLEELNVPLT